MQSFPFRTQGSLDAASPACVPPATVTGALTALAASSGSGRVAGLLRATLDRLAPALPVSLARHFRAPLAFSGVWLTMLKVKERRLGSGAIGMGPRRRFGTVLALAAAVFVAALWAQPAQAAVPGEPEYLSTQWLDASVKLTWNRLRLPNPSLTRVFESGYYSGG